MIRTGCALGLVASLSLSALGAAEELPTPVRVNAGSARYNSEWFTAGHGQGAGWAVNARYDGSDDPPYNMLFQVEAGGGYDTAAGLLEYDGNYDLGQWTFYSSETASTGIGQPASMRPLAALRKSHVWMSPRGNMHDFGVSEYGGVHVGMEIPAGGSARGLHVKGEEAAFNNGNIHLHTRGWGRSHAIIFGGYASSAPVDGSLLAHGNILHNVDNGSYASAAGLIEYTANGGEMHFAIGDTGVNNGDAVPWNLVMTLKRSEAMFSRPIRLAGQTRWVRGQGTAGSTALLGADDLSTGGTVICRGIDSITDNPGGVELWAEGQSVLEISSTGATMQPGKVLRSASIVAGSVKVDANWQDAPPADYVFDDDYDLSPLAEVDAFVKQNRHLPGVPSAAEQCEEGVDVYRMMNVHLEKIEELTLHAIAADKKLTEARAERDAAVARVEALEARLARIESLVGARQTNTEVGE